jgi:hypothetical protein
MRRRKILTLFAVLASFVATTAAASPLQWTLSGATFADSTVATGSFFYDASTNTYSNWNITTATGTGLAFGFIPVPMTGYAYAPASSFVTGASNASHFQLQQINFISGFDLTFTQSLTQSGGTVSLGTAGGSSEHASSIVSRLLTSGVVTAAAPIPEPSTYALMLAGLGFVGLVANRRRKSQVAV